MDKLIGILVVGGLLAGCTSQVPEARHASSLERHGCATTELPSKPAFVIEGFGGRGETQLIMTERRPVTQCVSAGPTGTAMAPVE